MIKNENGKITYFDKNGAEITAGVALSFLTGGLKKCTSRKTANSEQTRQIKGGLKAVVPVSANTAFIR